MPVDFIKVDYVVYVGLVMTFAVGLMAEYQIRKKKKLQAIKAEPHK